MSTDDEARRAVLAGDRWSRNLRHVEGLSYEELSRLRKLADHWEWLRPLVLAADNRGAAQLAQLPEVLGRLWLSGGDAHMGVTLCLEPVSPCVGVVADPLLVTPHLPGVFAPTDDVDRGERPAAVDDENPEGAGGRRIITE